MAASVRRWGSRAVPDRISAGVVGGLLESNKDASPLCAGSILKFNLQADMHELLPGFIHMQGVIPAEAQQSLLDISCAVASKSRDAGLSGGWYRREGNDRWSLNDGSKARFWDDISCFPLDVKQMGEDLAKLAADRFPVHLAGGAGVFDARVGALNFYTQRGKMGWHVDDTNFAKADRPIVMANLGDAADFGYKSKKSDSDRSVRLASGDVIVFGGRSRDLCHALLQVHPHTSPSELRFPETPGVGRVSVTWRDVGVEDGLTFNSDERLGLKVTENTLPRYTASRQQQRTPSRQQQCAQCGATIDADGNSKRIAYCQQCWKQWDAK